MSEQIQSDSLESQLSNIESKIKELSEIIEHNNRPKPKGVLKKFLEYIFGNEWDNIKSDIQVRHTSIQEAKLGVEKIYLSHTSATQNNIALIDDPNMLAIAATDVFVQKAQSMLTCRGRWLVFWSILIIISVLIILGYSANFLYTKSLADFYPLGTIGTDITLHNMSRKTFVLLLVKSSSEGACIVAAVVLLIKLAIALLHEATVLFHRRHALRFGRLFVYMNHGNVNPKDLQKVFQWNNEFSTAFKNINTELPLESLVKLLKETSSLVKELKPESSEGGET
jgi:hypothetical protein